jgi:hypothetical protein
MTQVHKRRTSNSIFVDTIWYTQNITDGIYSATPDGCWDLIMGTGQSGKRNMMLAGQATKPAAVPYLAGTFGLVISFSAGAFLTHIASGTLIDDVEILPTVDDEHFSLAGHTFAFPTFDNAEELVEQMARLGIVDYDAVVGRVLKGEAKAMSTRAVQRHFLQTTGLTRKQLQQIHRAQAAVRLIKEGKRPIDAALDTGYTDQPHLAKSLKRIMDAKPSNVDDIHKI